jgi:threonine/homoserine/homoserine lactone efflux protein
MNLFKTLFVALGGLILILLGLSIVLRQTFGIVMPALSTLLEIFGGLALIYIGVILLQKLLRKK